MAATTAQPDLVQRAVAGDVAAIQQLLVQSHMTMTAAIDRRIPADLRSSIDAADIVQDAHIRAIRAIGQFAGTTPERFSRWLLAIARHRLIELVRARRTGRNGGGEGLSGAAADQEIVAMLQQLAVYERTPSRSAIAHELVAALTLSLDRLSPPHRQALRMRYVDGMTIDAIARQMQRTARAVHMLCNRGLKSLRVELRSASRFM